MQRGEVAMVFYGNFSGNSESLLLGTKIAIS